MKCNKCGGTEFSKNGTRNGKQKFRCKDCGSESYSEHVEIKEIVKVSDKIGLSLDEFRQKHDVAYIVDNTLSNLDPNTIYEKSDIIRLTGLRPGYPGINNVLESQEFKKYSGRSGGVVYYSSPETISDLKKKGIMF